MSEIPDPINATKEEIFDWLMTFEDEAMEHMKEEVIKTAEYAYGPLGRDVAESYYKKIDGLDDDDLMEDESCDDCKQRAKNLIRITETISSSMDVLSSDIASYFWEKLSKQNIWIKLIHMLNSEIDSVPNCYNLTPDIKKVIIKRILLEVLQKVEEKDDNQT